MMRKESVNEEKVYIDYLNKQKGFKQDRIKFNSYEEAVKWARKNFEKFNSDMIKYESVNEYNVNKKFGSKYDIGAGSMGSGTIFWNRAEEEFGDYKKIAHVSDSGRITFYDKKLPSFVKKHVEDYAKTQNESINELTGNEKRIKDGNPDNVYYVFYKGKFDAVYWAMNPSDLFKIYWDQFKVRKPAGSQFKLNPEFIIVSKKEYDKSTSNHYAKLKPYVDKFWDKLQNESVGVNEAKVIDIIDRFEHLKLPDIVYLNKKPYTGKTFVMNGYNGYTSSDDDGWVYDSKTRKPLTDKQGNILRATTHRGARWDFKGGIRESVNEEKPGLWANIRAKQARGEAPSPKNSKAYKDAVEAGKEINKNESVNEATEPEVITQIKNIAKNHQNNTLVDPKTGKKMRVDAFSASAIATVYDALSDSSKEKFLQSGLLGMQQMAMKLLKR
jgi:hypothetical protein